MKLALLLLLGFVTACGSQPAARSPQDPPVAAKATGTLTGTVAMIGGLPCQQPAPGCAGYAEGYEVIVYELDGVTVAGKATATADGTFSMALPPGKYVIVTPAGLTNKARTEIEIQRDAVSTVSLRVDSGVRASAAP